MYYYSANHSNKITGSEKTLLAGRRSHTEMCNPAPSVYRWYNAKERESNILEVRTGHWTRRRTKYARVRACAVRGFVNSYNDNSVIYRCDIEVCNVTFFTVQVCMHFCAACEFMYLYMLCIQVWSGSLIGIIISHTFLFLLSAKLDITNIWSA